MVLIRSRNNQILAIQLLIAASGMAVASLITVGGPGFSNTLALVLVGTVVLCGLCLGSWLIADADPTSKKRNETVGRSDPRPRQLDVMSRNGKPPAPMRLVSPNVRVPPDLRPRRTDTPARASQRVTMSSAVLTMMFGGFREHIARGRTEETGWLLLGRRLKDEFVVTALIDAGPEADAGMCHVSFDRNFQTLAYELIHAKHPEEEILGIAHSHPGGMSRPSSGDLEGDSAWVRQLPGGCGLFIILTAEPRGVHAAVSLREGNALAYKGGRASFYLLEAGSEGYAPARPELALSEQGSLLGDDLSRLVARHASEIAELRTIYPELSLASADGASPFIVLILPLNEEGDALCSVVTYGGVSQVVRTRNGHEFPLPTRENASLREAITTAHGTVAGLDRDGVRLRGPNGR